MDLHGGLTRRAAPPARRGRPTTTRVAIGVGLAAVSVLAAGCAASASGTTASGAHQAPVAVGSSGSAGGFDVVVGATNNAGKQNCGMLGDEPRCLYRLSFTNSSQGPLDLSWSDVQLFDSTGRSFAVFAYGSSSSVPQTVNPGLEAQSMSGPGVDAVFQVPGDMQPDHLAIFGREFAVTPGSPSGG